MTRLILTLLLALGWTAAALAQDLRLVPPIGHTAGINSVELSPDGKTIVTASNDNTAKVWDVATGKELIILEGHTDYVNSAQFSPDGKTIVTAAWDNTAKVWDVATGQELISLEGHEDLVNGAQFSPDGKTIVTDSDDFTAKIWDVATGQELLTLKMPGEVQGYNPDGQSIVTADWNLAKVWDVATGLEIMTMEGHSDVIESAQFSPDGQTIVTTAWDNTTKVWDVATGEELLTIEGRSAHFSPNGKTIVTSVCSTRAAKIWDVATGRELTTLKGHSNCVNSAQFSPDGQTIITASTDNTAKIWDVTTGNELVSFEGHADLVQRAQFSSDGKTIVMFPPNNCAKVLDAASGQELMTFEEEAYGFPLSAQFSPDGQTIVTANLDNSTEVWDVATGRAALTLEGHEGFVRSAQFSPDGKNIVTAAWDETAKVWDVATGLEIMTMEGHSDMKSAQFSPDGQTIVTAALDNTAKVWDVATGQELISLEGHRNVVNSAQFSPDGQTIVTASLDYTAKLWKVNSGEELMTLWGYPSYVNSAHFSTDGRSIVTALERTAKVWSVETGQELMTLEGHTDFVNSAQFSPDGQTIVTASSDNTAKIWDVETGDELMILEGHTSDVNSATFSPNGQTIVTASRDYTTKAWDAVTGALLFTRLSAVDGSWLAWDPEYRYDGSPEAIEQLHFACGLEVIELSQAKEALYVPNLVSRVMNGEDLIGLPSLDDLDLCGRTPIVTPLPGDGRGYRFDIEPRKGGVSTCEVYIDGVRRFNIPASGLQPQDDGHLLLTVFADQVAEYATAAEAEVTVIARTADNLTSRGLKTWAAVADPRGNSQDNKPAFHGLFVGINDYKGDGLKLNYAAADARELGQVVEAAAAKMFGADEVHITTLLSDAATGAVTNPPEKHRLLAELEAIAERSNARDILFIHLAGHGNVNADGEFVFLTSEASSLQDGDYTGVTMREINDALMGVKASQRILILDACHSGEAVQDLVGDGNMDMAYTARNSVSLEEDVARGRQLERLGDNANMTMLTASASDQAAFELPEIGHGLLTFALLDAIQGHTDILDEGRFLEVKPWIYQAEKTVNERSTGPNRQRAQALTPANYPIGEITADVRDLIQIEEKPVIQAISLRNRQTRFDDLGLGSRIQGALKEGATRGGALFVPDSPNGIVVEGKYELLGDGTLRVTCEFFNASGFLGEAQWTEAVDADWPALISDWILAQDQD